MAAPSEPSPLESSSKAFLGLLNGVAQANYYGNAEITEELLREQLYPDMAPQEFAALRAKTTGLVKEYNPPSTFTALRFMALIICVVKTTNVGIPPSPPSRAFPIRRKNPGANSRPFPSWE